MSLSVTQALLCLDSAKTWVSDAMTVAKTHISGAMTIAMTRISDALTWIACAMTRLSQLLSIYNPGTQEIRPELQKTQLPRNFL
jgi:hypothetical protein